MDIASILGVVIGVFLVLLAVKENIFLFWSPPSLMITFGGAFAATLINFPLSQIIRVSKVVRKAFFSKSPPLNATIDLIIELTEKARKEGILSLENELPNIKDEFLKKAFQYVIDGIDRQLLKDTLRKEIAFLEERHRLGQEIFVSMGTYAPAFGMIGTLMGLILMLHNLDDPKKVGPGMAIAIITTFYGALAAYLVFLPIAGKLKTRSNEEVLMKEVILEGVLSFHGGESPRVIREKLKSYLALRIEKLRQLQKKPLKRRV